VNGYEFENADGTFYGQHYGWSISSATGEFARAAHLCNPLDIEFALSTSFERFRPIQGYEAMWSPNEGIIEAELVLRPPTFLDEHVFSELLRRLEIAVPSHDPRSVVIPFPSKPGDPIVSLRFASPALHIWRTTSPAVHLINKDELVPCIRIEGMHLHSKAEAKEQLEALGNGALLELDRRTGVAARLRTHYPWRIRIGPSRPKAILQRIESTPEAVPTSLYMHARLGSSNLAAQFEFRSFERPGGASDGCAGGLSSPRSRWRLPACPKMVQGSEGGARAGKTLEVMQEKLMGEVGC
jgi:hypothetical protein